MKKIIFILCALFALPVYAQTPLFFGGGGGGGGGTVVNPGTTNGQFLLWGGAAWDPSNTATQLWWDSTQGLVIHPPVNGQGLVIRENDDGNMAIWGRGFNGGGVFEMYSNGIRDIYLNTVGASFFNDSGTPSHDYTFEGDTEIYLLHTDAGTDRVGIGTGTPNNRLEVFHTSATPQFRLSYDGTYYATFGVNSAGLLTFGPDSFQLSHPSTSLETETFGNGALAAHPSCTSFGHDAIARDTASSLGFSSAFGALAIADGYQATALGKSASASGSSATAFGCSAVASANGLAVGRGATATSAATALGVAASAGDTAISIGNNANASGLYAFAVGLGANAGFNYSMAFGSGATNTVANQCMFGDSVYHISSFVFNEYNQTTARNAAINAGGMSGTNLASGTLTLSGGRSTGNAAGGGVIIQVANPGTAGTGVNIPVTKAQFGHALAEIQTNTNVNGVFDADAVQITTYITPPALAAHQNDYAPTGYDTCRIVRVGTTGGNITITGIGKIANRTLTFFNTATGGDVVFSHENTNSLVSNRIYTPNAGNITLQDYESVTFWHDPVFDRWVAIGRTN